jgi:2-aminobenzoate-CoA ligase
MMATENVNRSGKAADSFVRRSLPDKELWPEIINLEDSAHTDRFNCISQLLDTAVAEGYGDHLCLCSDQLKWTYSETLSLVNRIANHLVSICQLTKGERVMLGGPNSPMMAACWLAVVKAGGVAVSTMALLRSGELVSIANKAEVRLGLCDAAVLTEYLGAQTVTPFLETITVFHDDEFEKSLEEQSTEFEAADTAADDACLIAFTSGTTGQPKGCVHFHRDVLTICRTVGSGLLGLQSKDIFIGTPPLAFTFGLGGLLLFPLFVRGTAILLPKAPPGELAAAIKRFRATVCFTSPTAYRAMIKEQNEFDFSSLRKAISAGEALPRATYDAWKDLTGLKLIDGIGSTELLHIFISAAEEAIRPGAIGKPLPSWEAMVVNDTGNEVNDGQVGHLLVRGPIGCRYLNDSRQLDYVYNGWNRTGDKFYRDSDGYFWFQSRADDMIVSSGYNIAAPEVENALLMHEAVAEAAVIGVPDHERGNVVKAFVVTTAGYFGSDELRITLQNHVKETIAPYKYPRAIAFVDSLPKTDTGKIQRFKLRDSS